MANTIKLHRCRFLSTLPSSITCLAISNKQLAISYENNEIHVLSIDNYYEVTNRLYMEQEKGAIRAMVWFGNRLFSAGLHSSVVEWDVEKNVPLWTSDSYGGAVYKMMVVNSKLVAACEDGSIRIFTIEKEIVYDTMLSRQSSRCISLCYENNILAAGDDTGNIRVWSVNNNNYTFLYRITVSGGIEPTLIWDMKICNNNICTADSLGRTQFYDIKFGTLISSYSLHESSNMCIVADSKGTIYSSGIENKVVQFKYINNKYIPTASCRSHSHEISSLVILNDVPDITSDQVVTDETPLLISGGVDTTLCIYKTWAFCSSSKTRHPISNLPRVRKVNNFIQNVSVIKNKDNDKIMLAQERNEIHVWKMAEEEEVSLLGIIRIDNFPLIASSISPNGEYIVLCSSTQSRLYSVSYSPFNITRLFNVPTAYNYALTNSKLFLSSHKGVFSVDLNNSEGDKIVKLSDDIIHKLTVSKNGMWVAGSDKNDMVIMSSQGNNRTRLAFPEGSITALAFQENEALVVASGCKFLVFDLKQKKYTEHSRSQFNKIAEFANKEDYFNSISFNPKDPNSAIFVASTFIFSCKLNKDLVLTINENKKRKSGGEKIDGCCNIIDRYQPIVHASFFDSDEAVVVERPWLKVMQSLPDPLYRPVFGNK